MSEPRIFALLNRLWGDVHTHEFLWQVVALFLILGLSWWVASRLRRHGELQRPARYGALLAFGAGSVKRIAFPLIALAVVTILRKILEAMQLDHLSLLHVASLLLISWSLVRILVYVLRSIFPDGSFLTGFERLASFVIWSAMILEMTGLSETVIEWLEQVRFSIGKQKLDLWMLLHGTVTVCVILLIALWCASLIKRRLMAVEQMDGNLREVLARVAKAVLTLIALLLSLSLVGIDVTALSVFSGALAVGLGFGLQKIASNYVSGFIILLDRSIRLGNLVALDDNTTGTVTMITTRYCVLHTLSGTEVIIPNEYLVSNMVRNLSFSDRRVRVSTAVCVAYDTDVDKVMKMLADVALRHPRVLQDPAPGVLLSEFAENGINLELGFWIGDPETGTGAVRSEINLEILRVFRENGIEIPFPQRELRVIAGPAEPACSAAFSPEES